MEKFDTVIVKSNSARCLGKEYPFDHPVIYLEIPEVDSKTASSNAQEVVCPYCSTKFILDKSSSL